MTTLERSIIINTSWEAISKITEDATRLPEWYAGIEKTTPDEVYPKVGGTVDVVYKAAGINFKMKMVAIEFVRGQVLASKMEGMITGVNRWTYSSAGDGTKLTASFEYEMPGGGIGQAVNKLFVERMNTENLEKSLENLKALVESS